MPYPWRKAFGTAAFLGAFVISQPAQAQKTSAGQTPEKAHEMRSDVAIQDRIEHRLASDAGVGKYDISVKVNGGVVTLGGSVASDTQKAEAARLAKVAGVTKVDNELKVDSDVDRTLVERAKSGLTRTGESITDAWITAKVKWFLVGEDSLKGSDINVDTNKGVVTLKGTVASATGKTRAVELAKNTDGVSRVDDQLEVKVPAKTTNN